MERVFAVFVEEMGQDFDDARFSGVSRQRESENGEGGDAIYEIHLASLTRRRFISSARLGHCA